MEPGDYDEERDRRVPIVTVILMAACIWVFVAVQPGGGAALLESEANAGARDIEFLVQEAAIPCEVARDAPLTEEEFVAVYRLGLTDACSANPQGNALVEDKNVYASMIYSMFFHGGWLHLAGNMLFLWVFGNAVESRVGHLRYAALYLASGLIATTGFVVSQYGSALPVVGASGAIAGVMGAFLVFFPTARVRIWLLVAAPAIPAAVFLMFWFLSQFQIAPDSGIAWVSHVVGFVFGAVVATWLKAVASGKRKRTAPWSNLPGQEEWHRKYWR
jgi:membrane associated rhomboid family serine protease